MIRSEIDYFDNSSLKYVIQTIAKQNPSVDLPSLEIETMIHHLDSFNKSAHLERKKQVLCVNERIEILKNSQEKMSQVAKAKEIILLQERIEGLQSEIAGTKKKFALEVARIEESSREIGKTENSLLNSVIGSIATKIAESSNEIGILQEKVENLEKIIMIGMEE